MRVYLKDYVYAFVTMMKTCVTEALECVKPDILIHVWQKKKYRFEILRITVCTRELLTREFFADPVLYTRLEENVTLFRGLWKNMTRLKLHIIKMMRFSFIK